MKFLNCLFIALSAQLLLCQCYDGAVADERYADSSLWYDSGRDIDPEKADVFYLLPSCVYDWTDSTGTLRHNASVTDSLHRVRMARAFPIADYIFGDSANFFSPYYRQITLDAWSNVADGSFNEYLGVAFDDVRLAFRYYLEHWNQGRPFVLAGFSQGAMLAMQLIFKEMTPDVAGRMIAAYIIGYHIAKEEMDGCEYIRPAQGADDTGVCVVYSTVTDLNVVSPLVSGSNAMIINPASWTTDELPYSVNDTVTVRIDRDKMVLVADGIDASQYVKPKLAALFPSGNLHLLELELYKEQLRENVKLRINSFK